MRTGTDPTSPGAPHGRAGPQLARWAGWLAAVGAVLVIAAFLAPDGPRGVTLWSGYAALVVAASLAVVRWLADGEARFTLPPMTELGWTAVALVVLGLGASILAPFFTSPTPRAGVVQRLAERAGLALAALAVPTVLLAVWRRGERSVPTIALALTAGFVALLVLLVTALDAR